MKGTVFLPSCHGMWVRVIWDIGSRPARSSKVQKDRLVSQMIVESDFFACIQNSMVLGKWQEKMAGNSPKNFPQILQMIAACGIWGESIEESAFIRSGVRFRMRQSSKWISNGAGWSDQTGFMAVQNRAFVLY